MGNTCNSRVMCQHEVRPLNSTTGIDSTCAHFRRPKWHKYGQMGSTVNCNRAKRFLEATKKIYEHGSGIGNMGRGRANRNPLWVYLVICVVILLVIGIGVWLKRRKSEMKEKMLAQDEESGAAGTWELEEMIVACEEGETQVKRVDKQM